MISKHLCVWPRDLPVIATTSVSCDSSFLSMIFNSERALSVRTLAPHRTDELLEYMRFAAMMLWVSCSDSSFSRRRPLAETLRKAHLKYRNGNNQYQYLSLLVSHNCSYSKFMVNSSFLYFYLRLPKNHCLLPATSYPLLSSYYLPTTVYYLLLPTTY